MKKETLVAIFLGIFFGLCFAFFIVENLSQNKLGKRGDLVSKKKEVSISPIKTATLKLLTIDKPKNQVVVNQEQITIEGSAENDSLIVIQSPIKDLVFQNKNEQFKVNFPLALGENVIRIVAYPKNSNLRNQEKTLFIYYLPNEI